MSTPHKSYYSKAIPAMILAGLLSLLAGVYGAMTSSFAARDSGYLATLITIHAMALASYIPAFIVSIFWLPLGIRIQWFLVCVGILFFFLSAFHDGLVGVGLFSVMIPAIGGWVLEQREELDNSKGTNA
jgi:hypothetical protein